MSDHALPENPKFAELARLVKRLGEELAGYRKRALTAEARIRALEEEAAQIAELPARSIKELQKENVQLKQRLEAARIRTEKMLARMRFLQQQRDGAQ